MSGDEHNEWESVQASGRKQARSGGAMAGAGAGAAATTTAAPPPPFFSLNEYELLLQ